MRFPTTVNNNRFFRMVWWVITLPLESMRIGLYLPALLLYLLTLRNVTRAWGALWMAMHFEVLTFRTLPVRGNAWDELFIVGGLFLLFTNWISPAIRRFIRFMLTPFWRLRPRVFIPKPTQAGMALRSSASDPKQNRNRMTNRLSPELQSMVAKRD